MAERTTYKYNLVIYNKYIRFNIFDTSAGQEINFKSISIHSGQKGVLDLHYKFQSTAETLAALQSLRIYNKPITISFACSLGPYNKKSLNEEYTLYYCQAIGIELNLELRKK
jgi:hypothetical protein